MSMNVVWISVISWSKEMPKHEKFNFGFTRTQNVIHVMSSRGDNTEPALLLGNTCKAARDLDFVSWQRACSCLLSEFHGQKINNEIWSCTMVARFGPVYIFPNWRSVWRARVFQTFLTFRDVTTMLKSISGKGFWQWFEDWKLLHKKTTLKVIGTAGVSAVKYSFYGALMNHLWPSVNWVYHVVLYLFSPRHASYRIYILYA